MTRAPLTDLATDLGSEISDLRSQMSSDAMPDNSHYSIFKELLNYFRPSVETSIFNWAAKMKVLILALPGG